MGDAVCPRDMRGLVESIRKCGRRIFRASLGADFPKKTVWVFAVLSIS